ncbi:carboxymuconolactone decarboxylase family protein [Pectobacterium brasiliense]|uniref:Carboxymuconolactone decarboxylase family protein n=2 Tax=Pectobacterium TaxID=122277 RepID=A0AAP9LDU0_9GAMM|nr:MULTISPECIES: carboxymuconolactone decarboxylase family protein [Pectobacterium]AOR65714.1 alkylhydroperoxidase [Pectobacterium wasabiae CFBP 3304]APS30469.1 alkylhydroperoxidase [Pectobacterium brasiliense]ARA76086.1 carboxymuconolactone decarboxylase family protein [Pectobacterium brasiliense]EJS96662.1 Alkylhydroperoxidase AhpD [Pectobacterium wasabiae CFBP 3304]KFX05548.1 alkylhydroperoxidase [Pectobacterium wasabiae]
MAVTDWKDMRAGLLERVGDLGKLSPDTLKGVMTLAGAGAKTGHLDEKTRELIAIACAVTTRCEGCIAVHSESAVKAGASEGEIAEALGVAINMNAGAALTYSTKVLDAVKQIKNS